MNMKKLITITAMATTMLAIGAGTFESIPFNQPTFSEADPLGVTAITTAQSTATEAKTTATEAKQKATALETTIAETVQKGQLTNDVVIVGNAKGANGAGMESTTTSIVFAVNRDIDELDAENGEILFSADKVRFSTGIGAIWFGDSTIQSILAGAGQGEVNTIQTIKVNGAALTPDGDRAVDIVIPSPGDANMIESITVNGTALVPDANKAVAITIPDAGQNNVIEKITTNGVETTIGANKTVDIVIPTPGDANVIETVKVNGTALTPNNKEVDITVPSVDGKMDATNGVAYSDLKVYPMPSGIVGQSHTIITHESISIGDAVEYKENEITHNGESYEFGSDTNGIARLKDVTTAVGNLTITTAKVTDLDSYKNPTISAAAQQAITDINNANDIATIKSTLTNFLQNFVIQNP